MNRLYYGDNRDVLRRHVQDACVDLVSSDPPFNSNASYNVLFAEKHGTHAASQIKAFEDLREAHRDVRFMSSIPRWGSRSADFVGQAATLVNASAFMVS